MLISDLAKLSGEDLSGIKYRNVELKGSIQEPIKPCRKHWPLDLNIVIDGRDLNGTLKTSSSLTIEELKQRLITYIQEKSLKMS